MSDLSQQDEPRAYLSAATARRLTGRGPGLAPVEDEVALGEQPRAVGLDECVEVAQRCDHDLALAVGGEQVVRDRVALAGGPLAVEHHGALPVEMSRRLVLVQGLEDGGKCLTSFQDVGRVLAAAEQAGVVRAGLDPDDVLLALAGSWETDPATEWKARARTLYDLVFTGLRD